MLTVTDRASLSIPGDISSEEDFERPDGDLGARAAQAQRTPYYPGRPIDNRDGFFGRAHEARTALSLLGSLQSVSLVGPRRIGKTSLLHHISNLSVLQDHGFDRRQFAFIFVGCAELIDLSRDQILQLLLDRARAGVEQANTRGNEVIPLTQGLTFIDFSNMLSRLTQSGCKLIFLLDEFRYLASNRNLDPAFFAGLRSIASNLNVAYVTASSLSLLDLTYADRSVLGSPFFNIFSTIRLGLFEDRDARDLIINPSRAAGLPFSDATMEQILALADHHPFFLQVACFHAFDMQSQKGTLTEADHALLRERVADELKDHFRSAWGRLRPEDRHVLLSLDTAQDDPANQGVLETLRNQCLIRCEGKRWALPCSLWADFVRTQVLEASSETPTRVEVAAAQPPSYDGSPETCTVSVQVTAGKQIAVEVGGAARYVPDAPSTWDVTDEQIALLKQAAHRLFEKPEEWRVEARRIGEQLYAEIVGTQPEIRDAFGLALGQRRPQDVHLRFKVPRDYLQLPLEFLHDGKDWLALKHPLAKFITGELVRRPLLSGKLRQGEELRVLLVAASVSGEVSVGGTRYVLDSIPEVDYELEEVHSTLQRAAARMDMRLQPRILRSDEAVYEEVRRELRSGGYDFFHYSGHASHDSGEPDHSALFLRKSPADGSPVAMTAGELKSLLENSSLRFAYFSCCAGATQADEAELTHNDFLGIVDAAVQAGLPSALGMRWPVNDKGARTLAQAFYEALFPSGELDSALLAARQAVGRDDITWLSPVLVVQA